MSWRKLYKICQFLSDLDTYQNGQITSAVLRLECSLDCISGSVFTNKIYSVHFLTVSVSFEIKKNVIIKNVIWSVGHHQFYNYKLVLGPVPIIHTNFQENLQLVFPNYLGSVVMCLTRHYVMTDCKSGPQLRQAIPC